MTKRNRSLLAAALAVLMLLLACCGKKQNDKPTDATTAQTPTQYTVELRSDSDYPLEGIGIYVYTDTTMQELVWFARTDAEGKITFRDVTSEGYIAVLDGVSSDYIVEENYPLTGEHTTIIVQAQMQSGVDLSAITRTLGDVMFDFTITDCDGKEYTLTELLKEKDAVVLNFWYLNCGPCRQEFPYLQEAYAEYSDRIEVLAMNPVDGTDEEIAAFKKELELTFPMCSVDPDWANAMQLTAYPTTVIIDRYGVVSLIHTGSITNTKVFADAFAYFTAEDYVQGVVENIEDLETEVPGSNPNEPIELGGKLSFQATIPAGCELYYHLYRVDGTLSIKNENIYAVYGGKTYGPGSSGVSFYIKSPDTYTPAKLTLGNSGAEEVTVTVNIAKPAGVVDNPYSAKLDEEFSTKVPAGNDQGVYYQVTAPETGYLIFECLEVSSKVGEYDYIMQNLSTNAQRTLSSDGNTESTMVSIPVKAGQKVKCWIVATKDTSGNKYPGGTFKSKLYMSDTPVTEETEQVAKIDYAITVTDENRKPVEKVYLEVTTGDKKATWITDSNGVAHNRLEPGTYPVVLTLPSGYTAATTEFTLTEARPYLSVKLDTVVVETVTYTVTVTDESGAPLSGISVMIGSYVEVTDADGKAVFELPKDTYTVTVSMADGSVQNQTFGEGETEMTVVLDQSGTGSDPVPGGKITYTVKVEDFSGNAQSSVTVKFLKNGSPVAVKATDSSGSASAELESGDYTVSLAFIGKKKYYEASTAVLSADKPSLVVKVTATAATTPVQEWFGQVYIVEEGATYASMQANALNRYYFTPENEGLYFVYVTNPDATVGYYPSGYATSPADPGYGEVTDQSFYLNTKESNLGNSYIIGITGASETILVIERVGPAVLDEVDIPWVVYEGNPPTKQYSGTVSQSMTYVDLTAKTADFTPVLGSDGYYHLNSADGALLYVNLGTNARYVSMYSVLGASGVGGTKFGQIFRDENGNVTIKEDYVECMLTYITYRTPQSTTATYPFEVYPLTEDLMHMLKNGGDYMGWWEEGNGNYLFTDLGSAFNPELGWMFAVCY